VVRGGALKPTNDGNWAHVVCALAVPEVNFVDVWRRCPIDASNLTAKRMKLVRVLFAILPSRLVVL
jgi:jumonji domain-containing protein 2